MDHRKSKRSWDFDMLVMRVFYTLCIVFRTILFLLAYLVSPSFYFNIIGNSPALLKKEAYSVDKFRVSLVL